MTLKEIREKKGYTTTQVAKALGVNQSAVSMWESGARQIKMANLISLANLYKMPVLKLIKIVYLPEEKAAAN